jgi:EAL domain-containing protein (putative c-di-GMP-specific phosphodiesterase class I)
LDGQRYGVIVGVNECGPTARTPVLHFAEHDARALYDQLTDEATGTFDAAGSCLLTGRAASTAAVKVALRDAALGMSPADVLFVYFAGHAIVSPWLHYNDPYLATADLDPEALRTDPDRGLRMSFLRRDVFEATPGSSFLILDTCHARPHPDLDPAGAARRGLSMSDALRETQVAHSLAHHSALFGCPPDEAARESAGLRHGVLTHFMLRGLQGDAANRDGDVTFEALVDYVRRQDIQPEPGSVVQGRGPATVLTRFGARTEPVRLPRSPTTSRPAPRPLANPLETHLSTVQLLLDRVFRSGGDLTGNLASQKAAARLEVLLHAVDATAAAEVCLGTGAVLASAGSLGGEALDRLFRDRITGITDGKSVLGYTYPGTGEHEHRQLIIMLHQTAEPASALVLTDPAPGFLNLGEPLATILHVLWGLPATNDPVEAEVLVLTALRSQFGRLPVQLYLSCLATYRRLLDSLVMVFEPVMILSAVPEMIGIHSWEALARRDTMARRAPVAALAIPEKWGDTFVIERDTVLAAKAITAYARAHALGPWNHDNPKPVSINVSVRSLLNDAYQHALAQAIAEAGLAPHTVTLEISERDAIEPHPDEAEHWQPTPIAYFQARLSYLARTLHVNFAVDDFGVGHASLDRVSSLDLTEIKVDRAILHHSMALSELELVVQLANEALNRGSSAAPRAVVVEGFDAESPVALRELYSRGIRYVQGYITEEPASPYLRPLSEDVRRRVAAMVRMSP